MTCSMYMLCVRCFVKYCVRNLLKMLTVANGRTLQVFDQVNTKCDRLKKDVLLAIMWASL